MVGGRPRALLAACALALLAVALLALAQGAAADYATAGGTGLTSMAAIDANTSAVQKTSDTPLTFRVTDNLTISVGDILVISEGTELEFQNGTLLQVLGGIQVMGAAAAPVVMRVIPDIGGAPVDWRGLSIEGASDVRIEYAVFNATIDIAIGNTSLVGVNDVVYEGRMMFTNVTLAQIERVRMDPGPLDVGRVPLWFERCSFVAVEDADLTAGTGWGGEGVHIDASQSLGLRNLVLRTDNVNLIGVYLVDSRDVMVTNYTFTQGPGSGNPSRAVEMADSDRVWFEGITVTHVGTPVLGTIYGDNSNATIANSTFPAGLMSGTWTGNGKLTSLNATRLPAVAQSGGQVWEYELVMVQVNWTSGGAVRNGSAYLDNASWNVTGAVALGRTPWLWVLREWNDSVTAYASTAYTATVTCNCTGATLPFSVVDAPGAVVAVMVDDETPPTVDVYVAVAETGTPGSFHALNAIDNDAVAAFSWTGTIPNATGLPCSLPTCQVTFYVPGRFTVVLTATDPSGNSVEQLFSFNIADVTSPSLAIVSVAPGRPGQGEAFTVTATATDNDPGFLPDIRWSLDGVLVGHGGFSVSMSTLTVGPHTVHVEVADDAGNLAFVNRTVEVRDSTPPSIGEFPAPPGLIPGGQLELNGSVATDSGAGVVAWRWHVVGPGTDYNLSGVRANATLPSAGTYNITLTAQDAEGNEASRSFSVKVEALPSPTPGFDLSLVAAALAVAAVVGIAAFGLRRKK